MPPLDTNLAAWIEAIAKVVAIFGGVLAVFKILHEMRENRVQRAEELAWKRAEAAKKLNDEMLGERNAQAAMVMLDWDDREFEIKPGMIETINGHEHRTGLRVSGGQYSDKEVYVRDCFDSLFYYLALFEHHIRNRLIRFEDVEFPIGYFVGLMSRNRAIYDAFARGYGYHRALDFLNRFPVWNQAAEPPGGATGLTQARQPRRI